MKDPEIQALLAQEHQRQSAAISLIASENYISDDVSMALASDFGNKYAEGYPGARYYGGNAVVDELEALTQKRALHAFLLHEDEWAVNVQALSGSPANLAVYSAIVPSGGKIMGLALDHGGHLTHGHKASMTGTWWHAVSYTVNKDTEQLDHDAIRAQALAEKPALIVAGFTAYSRIIDWQAFRSIADECGALLHVDMSHIAGLVAGGAYPSPFPYADTVMTTTHKTLRGPRGALLFSRKNEAQQHDGEPRSTQNIPKLINKAIFPGLQGGPHMNTIAGIAVALHEAMQPDFARYAECVIANAQALAGALAEKGWRIIAGGTDTHLFLVDTWQHGISGQQASNALEQHGIIVNKNTIPYDTRPPSDPSGIRIGTAAETTRGKTEQDMRALAETIHNILTSLRTDA